MSETYVEHSDGVISFVGYDAVDLYRARVLASSLKLYAKTGIKPSRHITLKHMLLMATSYTGQRYASTKAHAMLAADHVKSWADAFALSIEHR